MFKASQSKKKLELKKTAIAHLTLSNDQLRAFAGGATATLHTSRDMNGDPNTCTLTGDDTKMFMTLP